jgi:hypothetical protein
MQTELMNLMMIAKGKGISLNDLCRLIREQTTGLISVDDPIVLDDALNLDSQAV